MKLVQDHVLIKVPSTTLNIASVVTNFKGEKVTIYRDTSHRPNIWTRINATVVATPKKLSNAFQYQTYAGQPAPRISFDAFQVEYMVQKHHDSRKNRALAKYNAHWFRERNVGLNEGPLNIKEGDEVWFMYHCIADERREYEDEVGRKKVQTVPNENFWKYDSKDGGMYFRIPYEHIFCVVRNNHVIPLNGFVFVEALKENFKEKMNFNGMVRKVKKQNGIIVSIGEGEEALRGILRHKGQPVGPDTRPDVSPGDQVLFSRHSEFDNKIAGKEYYVMRQWDIVAKIKKGEIIPVGDYVLIEPIEVENRSQIYLNSRVIPSVGYIKAFGANAKNNLGINRDTSRHSYETKDKEWKVLFSIKSSYYLFFKEYNKVLVRENDIMAVLEEKTKQFVRDKRMDFIELSND